MIGFTVVDAQTSTRKTSYIVALTNNSSNNKVEINFSAPEKINSLLVLIADSSGQIVFLDNKIDFKGTYKRIVDLRKGNYYLKINDNEERIIKPLIIE